MSDEAAFIQAILANPGDITSRLVYADWLEERGDPESLRRAEYIRIECELDGLPARNARRPRLRARLRAISRAIGDDWWRQLDWAGIEYCVAFEYRCPQRWDTLQATEDPAVRHCPECQRNVYYCRDAQEAHELADAGECVAIDSRVARLSFGRVRRLPAGRLLGKVAPSTPRRIPLGMRGSKTDQR
jgi:uncharacterized protein (TIGR02996 family)